MTAPTPNLLSLFAGNVIDAHHLQLQYSTRHTAGDNPLYRGHPDRDLLNRYERYEVLEFINSYCRKHGFGRAQALVIEQRIRNAPSHIHGKTTMTAWLDGGGPWSNTNWLASTLRSSQTFGGK